MVLAILLTACGNVACPEQPSVLPLPVNSPMVRIINTTPKMQVIEIEHSQMSVSLGVMAGDTFEFPATTSPCLGLEGQDKYRLIAGQDLTLYLRGGTLNTNLEHC